MVFMFYKYYYETSNFAAWGQFWERLCCDVCMSASANPFPKLVSMAKLHFLIAALMKSLGIFKKVRKLVKLHQVLYPGGMIYYITYFIWEHSYMTSDFWVGR